MVYLLLLVLGLIVLVQSYLLAKLLQAQRELEQKLTRLTQRKTSPSKGQPPRMKKEQTIQKERGQKP